MKKLSQIMVRHNRIIFIKGTDGIRVMVDGTELIGVWPDRGAARKHLLDIMPRAFTGRLVLNVVR